MSRRRTTTAAALAAAIVALTPAAALAQAAPGGPGTIAPAPPPPPPAPQVGTPAPNLAAAPAADVAKMAAEIRRRMNGNAFGWQFAIAQKGLFVTADKGGSSRSDADVANGGAVAMTPSTRYELASLTKNFTAVATMKLLRANGLTIESSIDPWLPASWTRGPGFNTKSVTFRHLLSHTSGIGQMLAALAPNTAPTDNGWDAMRFVVARGTQPNSQRQYKNANYALLRIANAFMWRKLGGTLGGSTPPVAKNTHSAYALDYLRRNVFKPAGLSNIGCSTTATTTAGMSYPAGATQTTKGQLLGTSPEECAGARGIRMSSIEVVRYLAHLRHGAIVAPADLATMDALRLGWNEDSNGGDGGQFGVLDGKPDNALSPGAFWHGGDLIGTNQVHTCGMTFSDGTEASLIVNSPLSSDTQCGVLLKSWNAAK